MKIHNKTRIEQEIPFESLLRTVAPATADSLRKLSEDADVDYIIILENASRDKRKFIPAGAGLDFRSPKDATGKIIGGMRMSGHVDLRKSAPTPASPSVDQGRDGKEGEDSTAAETLKRRIKWLEQVNNDLENKVSNAKKQILTRNQVIEEQKKQIYALQAKLNSLEQNHPFDDSVPAQNSNLEAAEEELINRMNEFMEKEAELEQREEDLFHKERRFHEMVNRIENTA
jgi:hypothetical protein